MTLKADDLDSETFGSFPSRLLRGRGHPWNDHLCNLSNTQDCADARSARCAFVD
jgi:hypothetical protein